MSALDRVKAALRRLSPSWPSTDPTTSVGKELDSIAAGIANAADSVDGVATELYPDTADTLLSRWEKVARTPSSAGDSLDTRRNRVVGTLRRTSGPRIDQLASMLLGPFALDVNSIIFIEPLRQFIEAAIMFVSTSTFVLSSTATKFQVLRGWPGVVDDTGVAIYIESTGTSGTFLVTSPKGTTWGVAFSGTGWYFRRTQFIGEPAGGGWTISMTDAAASTITQIKLLVSNDVDSAAIYNFYALRDAALAGTPDIAEAQRLFARTAHGHNNAKVIERPAFLHGDIHSLHGREPHGVV